MTIDQTNATHYLIVRPPDPLAEAAGMSDGFMLLAVVLVGDNFDSPVGPVAAHDDLRFMYAADVARAVQRGSATTKSPGVVVGQRLAALAAYPHLRLRHLLQGAVPPPKDGSGESADFGLSGTAPTDPPDEPVGSEPEPADEATDTEPEPADEATDTEPEPADEAADTEPEPADEASLEAWKDRDRELAARTKVHRPSTAPSGLGGDVPTGVTAGPAAAADHDDQFAAVLATLEQGNVPDLGELADLPRTGRGWQAVVDASAILKPAGQLQMAQDLVLQLLGEDETRAIGQRWLLDLADRFRNRSDLLILLIHEIWQYADPQAALQELRNGIRRGSVRISQRSPMPVAPLMRDLARTADDGEALADAYIAMADAPERRNDCAALLSLVQEIESEESGGNGERIALGLQVLQRAYGRASGDDFVQLAPHAERHLRSALRQDPVNLDAAESIRPMLEAALAHVDESTTAGIQDSLRELQLTLGGGRADDQTSVGPKEIVKLADALDFLDAASVNVEVLPSAYDSAAKWGKKTHKYLPQVMGAMKAIAEVADAYAAGDIGPDGLYGAFTERGQDFVRRETDQTRQRYGKKYIAKDAQGRAVQLESHLRLGADFRIYLTADKSTRRVLIGHVGEHLKVRRG